MSADNYYVIAQDPQTKKWMALIGFMSDERPVRLFDRDSPATLFDSERQAWAYAETEYAEYGIFSAERAPFGIEAYARRERIADLLDRLGITDEAARAEVTEFVFRECDEAAERREEMIDAVYRG